MDNVALVYVNSSTVKRELFDVLVAKGYKILEASDENELKTKYFASQDEITLYIQEFQETDKEGSFELLKIIDRQVLNTVLLIHDLDIKVIEEASVLNVKDVVKIPFTFNTLSRRLEPFTNSENAINTSDKELDLAFDFSVLEDEISRAKRGNYPVMTVIITYDQRADMQQSIFDSIKQQLRTTDTIESFDSENILLHCPFTPKVSFAIVENKIKKAFDTININSNKDIYVSAVTFPDDADDFETIKNKIKDQLFENRLFYKMDNPKNTIDLQAIRSRLRRNF